MAIIATKQSDGSYSTSYTGMDAIMHDVGQAGKTFRNVAKSVIEAPGKAIDSVVGRYDAVGKARQARDNAYETKNFGSPMNYQEVSTGKQPSDAAVNRAFGSRANYEKFGKLMQ